MLSKSQEKLIRSLHSKKGRQTSGFCLVEGEKNVEAAAPFIDFSFTNEDSEEYEKLLTTETPQNIAAVAKIPTFTHEDVLSRPITFVLDGLQDPGNVGGIIRLAHAFNASLLLIESADPTNPKVIRSSAGSVFFAPWMTVPREEAVERINNLKRRLYRLERAENSADIAEVPDTFAVIAGSEGKGIQLPINAPSLEIEQDPSLESLNVSHALAIVAHTHFKNHGFK